MTIRSPRSLFIASVTALFVTLLWSCVFPLPTPPLLPDAARAPPEIRRACDMTARRCTRCHTVDRILAVRVTSPRQWESHVARMRHMPASGIGAADGKQIIRCLVYRSFGTTGESP